MPLSPHRTNEQLCSRVRNALPAESPSELPERPGEQDFLNKQRLRVFHVAHEEVVSDVESGRITITKETHTHDEAWLN